MKGGYKIIDCKKIAIDDQTGANIPGIYDAIEGNLGKPILLSGVNNDGTLLDERFVTFTVDSTIYYGVLSLEFTPATSSENAGTPATVTATILKVESDDDVSIVEITLTSAA